jgi:plastocyanin
VIGSGRTGASLTGGALTGLLLAACGAPSPVPAPGEGDQTPGRIAGVVTTTAKARPPIRITTDTAACGTEIADEAVTVAAGGGLAHVAVVITGLPPGEDPPDVTIANDACRFEPRVQVARPGQAVRTLSRDTVLHTTTAHAQGGSQIFNLALPVPNLTLSRPIGGPGVAAITCQMHPWMRAWIVVTDERARVTGADGAFAFDAVPPGRYELRFWHEALGETRADVTVTAGATATLHARLQPRPPPAVQQ